MSNQEKISIVLPARNVEDTITIAIESILNQTLDNLELIIINDGSTDGTLDAINFLSSKDARIQIINHSKSEGLSKSLNDGMERATGKYIARMDGDDIAYPTRLENQYAFLESNPDIGLLGTSVESFGDKNGIRKFPSNHDELKVRLFFEFCFEHPTLMFRKSIVDRHHLFYNQNLILGEDLDLCWRFACVSRVGNLDEPLLKLRQHANRTHRVLKSELKEGCIKTFKNQIDDFGLITNPLEFDVYCRRRFNEPRTYVEEVNIYGKWLNKLLEHNRTHHFFSNSHLLKVVAEQWASIVKHNFNKSLSSRIKYFLHPTSRSIEPKIKRRWKKSNSICD